MFLSPFLKNNRSPSTHAHSIPISNNELSAVQGHPEQTGIFWLTIIDTQKLSGYLVVIKAEKAKNVFQYFDIL